MLGDDALRSEVDSAEASAYGHSGDFGRTDYSHRINWLHEYGVQLRTANFEEPRIPEEFLAGRDLRARRVEL